MTGRGLMGQSAFRQLRAMIDELLAKKANLSDVTLLTSGNAHKGQWLKFATVNLSGQPAYTCVGAVLEFTRAEGRSPHGAAYLHIRNGATAGVVGDKAIQWVALNETAYANSLALIREADGVYGIWYKPVYDWETPTVTVAACRNRHLLALGVTGGYVAEPDGTRTVSTLGASTTWANVTDKPSTYPPATHNHDAAYVAKTSAGVSAAINLLATGTATPTDKDYLITQYAGGGTTTTTYHRRPMSALWTYVKAKADATYLGKTANAASASKLASARRITFEGAATGSALFDGSGDVTVTLSSSAQAPSFLAAYPPGSVYRETTGQSPASRFGGTWRRVDGPDGFAWVRTDKGEADNFAAAQFLAAHPVGCLFEWENAIDPGSVYGGTWQRRPSLGAFTYERMA